MDGFGYSNATFDSDFTNTVESPEIKHEKEIQMLKKQSTQYMRNLLTNAQKYFAFLERQSLVNFIEACGGYVVSAGRDHCINIWDAIEGKHIRRLSGHTAPITGLQLLTSEQKTSRGIIISSSEDCSIRRWSLNKGEELGKIEVDSLITCMGVINASLAVIGNHRGYLEVRHLEIGELYSSILAHEDPVDALVVEGTYACSATFELPSCLKVWEVQFEQMICIYRIENTSEIQFCSLAIWNTLVFLGASDEQKVHVIDFKTNEKGLIDLGDTSGRVQHVRVWNEWILSCSECQGEVVLDVHRIHNYEHFGTFNSDMKQVFAIAAMESDSSFKIVLGGSALAILSFDFSLTQDQDTKVFQRYIRNTKPPCFAKNKIHCTIKNTFMDENHEEKSSDSDGDINTEDINYNSYENMLSKQKHKSDKMNLDVLHTEKELGTYIGQEKNEIMHQTSVLTYMYPVREDNQFFFSDETGCEKMFQNHPEPRATIRQLEKMLDENNRSADINKIAKHNEIYETLKEDKNIVMKVYRRNEFQENSNEKYEVTYEGLVDKERNQANTDEMKNVCSNLLKMQINESNIEKEEFEKEMLQENKNSENADKVSTKKKEKSKADKKKSSQKCKHKKCHIM